jgi:hypothetical protein
MIAVRVKELVERELPHQSGCKTQVLSTILLSKKPSLGGTKESRRNGPNLKALSQGENS